MRFEIGARGGISANVQPEKRLMLAVLEDALSIYRRPAAGRDRQSRRLFLEVEGWFASDDESWPFSFVNVCHALALDPGAVRKHLDRRSAESPGEGAEQPKIVRFLFRSSAARNVIGDRTLRRATRMTADAH